ncbi:hypothetical protein HY967_04840 [Candidatus Jorgensenbacteria bacterium]|nr:hypothetical protein [Candidatus Jorgensenbacteria bacterium]
MNSIREKIADIQHAIWSHWMKYLFSVCVKNDDGSYTIPIDQAERWERQMWMSYEALSEKERDSDREEADKVLKVIQKFLK